MNIINYFGLGMDAKRYAEARPAIHSTAIEKFRKFAQINVPLPRVLDVGCGTGQSSVILTDIAESVIGLDSSIDMLAYAVPHAKIEYIQSKAEEIPLQDMQFDLITVAQAFHWFDQGTFLSESNRLLKNSGWLLLYTSWFTSKMKENPGFSDWFNDEYLHKYPTPPRTRTTITENFAQNHGFTFLGEEDFSNKIGMTIHQFIDYMLSTTNIIAAVDKEIENFDDANQWLYTSINPFFKNDPERTFLFSGKIWYLNKNAE